MDVVYQAISQEIGKQLGLRVNFTPSQPTTKFNPDNFDVAFVCGLLYVNNCTPLEPPLELLVAPILRGPRYAGEAVYYSDIIVHKNSGLHSFSDLNNKRWAYNETESYSGYWVVEHYLSGQ